MPPLRRQPWFQGILIALAVTAIVRAHQSRVARLLEIERVRTRIASDLHDDIGFSLSQIAILSEVAHQRAAGSKAGEPIERIGTLSRELLDSIGDIVWAIQPRLAKPFHDRENHLSVAVLGMETRRPFRSPGLTN